jgi:hypothetical protein
MTEQSERIRIKGCKAANMGLPKVFHPHFKSRKGSKVSCKEQTSDLAKKKSWVMNTKFEGTKSKFVEETKSGFKFGHKDRGKSQALF